LLLAFRYPIVESGAESGFFIHLYAFFTPAVFVFTAFLGAALYAFHTGIFLLLENNMDSMDGIVVAAIALLWLVTWGSVLGCVKLGAHQ
jgi:hypothetical protein